MACNRCGHTKSSPCARQDHGLTTPCSYTNCKTSECEEVYCVDCVIDCSGTTVKSLATVWDAEVSTGATSTAGIRMKNGDSVTEMLQRIALFSADPVGGAKSASIAIAPISVGTRTSTSVQLNWANVSATVLTVSIYQALAGSLTWTLNSTVSSKVTTTLTKTITGLAANTAYKFKLVSNDGTNSANTVAVYADTLIA